MVRALGQLPNRIVMRGGGLVAAWELTLVFPFLRMIFIGPYDKLDSGLEAEREMKFIESQFETASPSGSVPGQLS